MAEELIMLKKLKKKILIRIFLSNFLNSFTEKQFEIGVKKILKCEGS